jgi:hypothetical protein
MTEIAIQTARDAMSDCEENLRRFLLRRIGQWSGLSNNCKKREVLALFAFNEGEGVTHFGTNNVEYQFHALRYEGFVAPAYFYFLRDQLSHITAEFWSFDPQMCADILRQLGEPRCRLEFAWKERMIPDSELLYADRGIAVGVIPETGLFGLVTVFPSCAINLYKENYWNTKLAREFRLGI